ncbi:hypothetical protein PX699_27610 [Sphingobium sp. H39-3-25]|uniref:hypothetical protein n=1 Tax=Sphingobium arseniciresistens TaxID=3030834 RepID=UPI0023B98F3E|nr:hypothetical protein [Sphingobium arseniciresistens]
MKNNDMQEEDAPIVPAPPLTPEQKERIARQRYFAIGLFRLSGVFVLMFGFLIIMQRFSWVQGDKAKMMGAILSVVGLVQTLVIPRLLLAAISSSSKPGK